MRKVNLLLGNAERRTSNLLEAAVLDVCYDQAAVECVRTSRLEQFQRLGCSGAFDLIIVAAENLENEPGRRTPWVELSDVAEVLHRIKSGCGTPLLVLANSPENEMVLLETGADAVFSRPLVIDNVKAEVRRLLDLKEIIEEAVAPNRLGFWGGLVRGLQRPRNARPELVTD
ncbi:MAG TPA: hypothetical protein VG167_20695 [Verrucomicrobiae bacterium]|nr:hypothetical protein [Verrucomicrobiae bacterium]